MDILVPDGGALVALAEVYVDESGSHEGSPILAVGGYIFLKSRSRAFHRAWHDELRRRAVPHFHMTDCANGRGLYKDWSMERRIAHETRLIELTRRYSSFGFAMCLSEKDYEDILGERWVKSGGGAYTFLLNSCLTRVSSWAYHADFRGKFAYFFEAGHRDAAAASAMMSLVTSKGTYREDYRYVSHAFIDKDYALPIQAADLLAWLARNTVMKYRDNKNRPRKDAQALVRKTDHVYYYDRVWLSAFRQDLEGNSRPMEMIMGRGHYFLAAPPRVLGL